MRKLGGLDAMFLYGETAAAPMHIGGLMDLSLPAGKDAQQFFQDFREMLEARLHLVDYLTHKLEVVPYDIDHPVWVKDYDFELSNHLQFVELPTGQDLQSFAAELYEPLMDRSRPLWEIWVIDLHQQDKVALFQKTHHAAIDGVSSLKAAELMYDFSPEPRAVEPAPDDFWVPETRTVFDLWNQSFENLSRYWWDTVNRLPQMAQTMAQMWQREFANGLPRTPQNPPTAPRTRLNRSINEKRAFRNVAMSLPLIKQLAKTSGVKINDVMLAICGEGVNRYLAAHDEQVSEPLLASCPVSLHRPGDTAIRNRVSSINISMANDVQDLGDRLQAIHAASKDAKDNLENFRDVMPDDFGGFGLPAILQQFAQSNPDGVGIDLMPRVPMSFVLSNVPGFTETMYVAGAKLESQMPMSIVTHGAGVNLTVTGYTDRLDLGITAATRCIDDIDQLAACLESAYNDYIRLGTDTITEIATTATTDRAA